MVENLSEVCVRSDLAVVDCNEGIVILKVVVFFFKIVLQAAADWKGAITRKILGSHVRQ